MRPVQAILVLALGSAPPAVATEFILLDANEPGRGFKDARARTPDAGNIGTTLGAQRVLAFQAAGAIWAATLRSPVPIRVDAAYLGHDEEPAFDCSVIGGILGYTLTSRDLWTDPSFPNPQAGYVTPLASALAGQDLAPGEPHVLTRMSAEHDEPGCTGLLLYGLDRPSYPWFTALGTLLHELGHGLGFVSNTEGAAGSFGSFPPAAFDFRIVATDGGAPWVSLTEGQRQALASTPYGLGFDSEAVRAALPRVLGAPGSLSWSDGGSPQRLQFRPAQFSGGATLSAPLTAANPLDACSGLPGGSLTGQVALIVRGGACSFHEKATRARAAGAVGVLVFNDVPTMSSEDYVEMLGFPQLDIPVLFISQESGQALQQALLSGPVSVTAQSDERAYGAGGDAGVYLYSPPTGNTAAVSHFDLFRFGSSVFPAPLLMQADGRNLNELDLTPAVMAEVGWSVVRGLGVAVVKALSAQMPVGADSPFLIAVVNHRATPIDSATLGLTVPAGASIVSREGPCSGPLLPCALGRLEPGEIRLVTAVVRASPAATGPFTVTAQVAPSSADAQDSLVASITPELATGGDVRLSITAPAGASPGANASFRFVVANDGPGTATDVRLTGDTGGRELVPSASACGHGFPCDFGSLSAGEQKAFDVVVRIPNGFSGAVTVSGQLSASTPDSNAANSAATASLQVAPTGGGGTGAAKSGCSAAGGSAPWAAALVLVSGLAALRRSGRRQR